SDVLFQEERSTWNQSLTQKFNSVVQDLDVQLLVVGGITVGGCVGPTAGVTAVTHSSHSLCKGQSMSEQIYPKVHPTREHIKTATITNTYPTGSDLQWAAADFIPDAAAWSALK